MGRCRLTMCGFDCSVEMLRVEGRKDGRIALGNADRIIIVVRVDIVLRREVLTVYHSRIILRDAPRMTICTSSTAKPGVQAQHHIFANVVYTRDTFTHDKEWLG